MILFLDFTSTYLHSQLLQSHLDFHISCVCIKLILSFQRSSLYFHFLLTRCIGKCGMWYVEKKKHFLPIYIFKYGPSNCPYRELTASPAQSMILKVYHLMIRSSRLDSQSCDVKWVVMSGCLSVRSFGCPFTFCYFYYSLIKWIIVLKLDT